MLDMDRQTGEPINSDLASIRQSIGNILTTLVGTRIERRAFGSVLPLLIDQPLNDATLLRAYTASIVAIQAWESRVHVERIQRRINSASPGSAVFSFDLLTAGGASTLDIDLTGAAA